MAKAFHNNEQPFDRYQFPHLFYWWESIRPIVSKSIYREFDRAYLRREKAKSSEIGLIPAWRAWANALHETEPFVRVIVDKRNLLFQKGRGRPSKVRTSEISRFLASELLV